jgi:hypothetical protein
MSKMKKILAPILFVATTNVNAQFLSDWSTLDKSLLVGATAAHIVDWGQTRTIAYNPDKWTETNPFLGKNPSVGSVNNYFLSRLILLPLAAHYLPEYRTIILSLWLGAGVGFSVHNYSIGIRMTW